MWCDYERFLGDRSENVSCFPVDWEEKLWLPFWREVWYNGGDMVGLAQMVRASDCGPEGRWFDSSIPPHV